MSNQVLAELAHVLLRKYDVSANVILEIAKGMVYGSSWSVVDYGSKTVIKALECVGSLGNVSLFDALISETMKESGISQIMTENVKDFVRIPSIRIINPFKS